MMVALEEVCLLVNTIRESYSDGVRSSTGSVLTFTQQAPGRWFADGRVHSYFVVKHGDVWTTFVVFRDSNHVVDVNIRDTRYEAQEVAEEYEDLEPLFDGTGVALGLNRIALANRNVAQRHFPSNPDKWHRRVPRVKDLEFISRFK